MTSNSTTDRKLSDFTDDELLKEVKKRKKIAVTNAFLIGLSGGIIIYSILTDGVGFFTLVPLYFIYRLVNNSNYSEKELYKIVRDRNLK